MRLMCGTSEIRNFYPQGFQVGLSETLKVAPLLWGISVGGDLKGLWGISGAGRVGEVCPLACLT